jgi:zinc metalloprotease ZmpB
MTDPIRNEYGEVVFAQLTQPARPTARGGAPSAGGALLGTAQQVAEHTMRTMRDQLGLGGSMLAADALGARGGVPVVEFVTEKDIAGTKVVVYRQTIDGLEVFEASLGMQMDAQSLTPQTAQSSIHGTVTIENPGAKKAAASTRDVSVADLERMLGFTLPKLSNGRIERQVVYRFEPAQREERHDDGSCIGEPAVKVPALRATTIQGLAKGQHYIVDEVLFSAALADAQAPVHWRALVEPGSGDVLYLRALVSCATGLVFDRDPQVQSGAAVSAASTNAQLNPHRTSLPMAGLAPATPQPLSGKYVVVTERQAPVQAPPTVPNPAGSFGFDAQTEDFTATCGYHNCDRLFRTMEDYGFDVPSYFDGTTFPVACDVRALNDAVNAQAPGTPTGKGLLELRFGRMLTGQTIGIATSNGVAWHEFGHALLWDHVSSPNFGFAHSAGDALAAILNDPGSQAPDRFITFPWVHAGLPGLDRRHDRAVGAGWAWFGPNWDTQYGGEQVLSSTLFRFYRSIGGDATSVPTQKRAATTSAFLIMKAIGQMTATTPFPEIYEQQLETADRTTADFKGVPGGALHKVMRWSFEKQGLFQPGAAPGQPTTVNTEGRPPAVDVYIDDGRNGEYAYLANHWSCQDMWVRRAPDGGLAHQEPIVGRKNYMYVRVKNRGTQAAPNVRVDAYHCLPGAGLSFPDDWQPMHTPTLPAGAALPSGGQTIVGPFVFVPTQVGHECLLAIAHADGDAGNDTTIQGTIPEHRFVPFDNNIGQRNVSPVLPLPRDILRLLRRHRLWIRNPWDRSAVVRVEPMLPAFMRQLGWKFSMAEPRLARFKLGPREKREIVLAMEPGRDFDAAEVRRTMGRIAPEIAVRVYVDDELLGGMSYPIDLRQRQVQLPVQPTVRPGLPPATGGRATVDEVLDLLRSEPTWLGARGVRTVRLEFDLDDTAPPDDGGGDPGDGGGDADPDRDPDMR